MSKFTEDYLDIIEKEKDPGIIAAVHHIIERIPVTLPEEDQKTVRGVWLDVPSFYFTDEDVQKLLEDFQNPEIAEAIKENYAEGLQDLIKCYEGKKTKMFRRAQNFNIETFEEAVFSFYNYLKKFSNSQNSRSSSRYIFDLHSEWVRSSQ